jgi:hypothetical protein
MLVKVVNDRNKAEADAIKSANSGDGGSVG